MRPKGARHPHNRSEGFDEGNVNDKPRFIRDPYELNSLHRVPNFFPIRNFLHRQMTRLIDCVGRDCQEVAPPLPLTRKEAQRLQAQKRKEARERERERESGRKNANSATSSRPMDLSVAFLGTGGSVPSARRSPASVLITRGGERLMFDCGEGTQRQLQRSTGLAQVDAIHLTHFHADHVLGLELFALALRERPDGFQRRQLAPLHQATDTHLPISRRRPKNLGQGRLSQELAQRVHEVIDGR